MDWQEGANSGEEANFAKAPKSRPTGTNCALE